MGSSEHSSSDKVRAQVTGIEGGRSEEILIDGYSISVSRRKFWRTNSQWATVDNNTVCTV